MPGFDMVAYVTESRERQRLPAEITDDETLDKIASMVAATLAKSDQRVQASAQSASRHQAP
jgi:hypothetical protein